MRLSKAATLLFASALLFGSGAMAGEINTTNINLVDKVTVEGKTIEPGRYKVEWTASGASVQVTVTKGNQQIASFPAHLTEQAAANSETAYSTTAAADGTKSLTAIYVGGKKAVLQIDQASASNQNNPSQAK
jgi:hypothetical protein